MPQMLDIKAIRKLSVKDRQKLLGVIWKSLVEEDADVQISEAAKNEIRRRRDEMRKHPERAISHDEMLKRLRSLR